MKVQKEKSQMKHNWMNKAKKYMVVMLLVNLLFTNLRPILPGDETGVSLYGEEIENEELN